MASVTSDRSKRAGCLTSGILAICALSTAHGVAVRAPLDRPNLLLFFVDDLGYGDVGYAGAPSSLTPNIDRFAFEGRRLSTWYSGYPVCSASRTALLTGRQPPRVGMPGVINSLGVEGLPLNETTVADHLKQGGYKTGMVGKWHQGQRPQYLPLSRGFDAFYGLPFSVDDGIGYCSNCSGDGDFGTVAAQAFPDLQLGPAWPLPLLRQSVEDGSFILNQPTDLEPLSRSMASFVKNFTTKHRNEPWFMYVAHPHVHTATSNIEQLGFEQYAGCPFANTSKRGPFGDALAELDWMLGDIVDHVTSLGIAKNTLVLFTSDNGPWLMKNQGGGSMGPFTGLASGYQNTGKGSTWEGGIREPAFAYWPGTIPQRSRTLEVFSTLDILPTFLALAGIDLPRGHVLDGVSNTAALLGTGSAASGWRDRLLPFWNGQDYSKVGTDVYAGRWNQYKFHWISSRGLIPHSIANASTHDPPLVFDVMMDPSEAFPLKTEALPAGLLEAVQEARENHKASLTIRHIDPRFGKQWVLCCNWNTNCSCSEPVPLPLSSDSSNVELVL